MLPAGVPSHTGHLPFTGFISPAPQWIRPASPAPMGQNVVHISSPSTIAPSDAPPTGSRPSSPAQVIVQQCRWEDCDVTFTSPEKLRRHISRKHIGTIASKNRCLVCKWKHCDREGRPFKTRSNAVSHVDCHIQGKPYSCPHCFTSFKRHPDLSKHILTIHGPQARDQHEYLRQQRAAQRKSATSSADSFTDGDEAVDEEDGSVGAVSEPDEDPSRSAPQIRLVGQHSIASAPRPTESQTPLNLFLSDSAGTSHQHHRPLMNNASGSGAPQPAASRSPYPPPQGSGVAFLLQANQIAERGYHAASAPPAHAAGSPYAGPTMPQYHLDDAKVSVLPPLSQPPSQPPSNDRPAFAPAYSVPQEMSYRPVPMPAAAPAPVLSWRPAPAAGESTSENKMPLARLLNPATPAETLVNALRHSSHRGPLRADETAFCMRLASELSEIAATIHQAAAQGTISPALLARLRRLAHAIE